MNAHRPRRSRARIAVVGLATLVLSGCGDSSPGTVEPVGGTIDPTPTRLDGTPSYEFEQDDLDAAAGASDAVKDYCAGAVSEAQRLGCESHVTSVP